jgi:hypothetical protein
MDEKKNIEHLIVNEYILDFKWDCRNEFYPVVHNNLFFATWLFVVEPIGAVD